VNFRGIVAAHGTRAESDQRKKLRLSAKDIGIKSAFFGEFNSLCAPEPISNAKYSFCDGQVYLR
jgi:hypothetical protein